jgi:hypothetical protein
MANESHEKKIKEICDALAEDSVLRVAIIRAMARDHPKDFLAPVKINEAAISPGITQVLVSNKEWQE